MSESNSEAQVNVWLASLTSAESKRHEAAARAIAKTPTYDERVITALKHIALNDPKQYARDAAKDALQKIAQAHFLAGNDIRAYLEKLRAGELTPRVAPIAETKPAQEIQAAPFQPLPKQIEPEPTRVIESAAPASPNHPITQSPALASPVHPVTPSPTPQPPTPAVPFDQWLLSERNIKLALYSGGLLLVLAGLIFVGINWNYLPGIAKLSVTLGVTLGMYVAGAFLFQRQNLKIGGIALLAIASGFLPLNFVVTHIYLTNGDVNLMWLIASVVCGAAYFATALWTRHNLFTVFGIIAAYSGATAAMVWLEFDFNSILLGYALVTVVLWLGSFETRFHARGAFMARTLRVGAHIVAPILVLVSAVSVIASNWNSDENLWFALVGMLLLFGMYALDDWQYRSQFARWGAAISFGIFAVALCLNLNLSSIQSGIVLKILAAAYLVLGKFLLRGKKLDAGLPLYIVATLLALLVTAQATLVYQQSPQHLALALVGDVALLSIAAFLFRRVEFVYGAAWLVLAPVFIYGNVYLNDWVARGLVFGVVLLVDAAVGYYFAARHLQWAMPFLSVAAFLSVVVPALLIQNYAVQTGALLVIAFLYAALAIRLQLSWLVLAAIAAINFAIASAVLFFVPLGLDAARVLAFAFCAWAVILFYARRGLEYVRLKEWAQPFQWGALANFGLTYLFLFLIASEEITDFGLISSTLGLTLLWLVALLALTTYLYRHVEFLYGATFLFIAPVFIFARLYLLDSAFVGLGLGALMLGYVGAGYFIGRARLKWSGAFLAPAAFLSVLVVAVVYPNYAALTALLVVIGLVYAFCAVWLKWRWLTLAALGALNLALLTAIASVLTTRADIQIASAIGYSALGVALLAGGVELKRRNLLKWREPFYLVAGIDFVIGYALALANNDALVVALSVVGALVCFAMQWVEREPMRQLNLPPALSYLGALVVLNGSYFAMRAFHAQNEFVPVAVAACSAIFVLGALGLRRAEFSELFSAPLRYVGLVGIVCMLAAAIAFNHALAGALTFALAALAFGADGFVRKQIALVYASGGAIVGTIWWSLLYFNITEIQAFAIPLGVLGLAIGWSELRRGKTLWFQLATLAGLVVLLGSAFYQSLSNIAYAALLLIESFAIFGIGLRMHSRIYVQAAIVALFLNGIAQFGPAFVNLERWIQIGTIGSILLIAGLAALFRRQKLLDARRALTSEWKAWKP